MADTSKSIMDAINDVTVAAGGKPCGGSIVDCIRHYSETVNGSIPADLQAGNATISDAAKAILSASSESETPETPEEPEEPAGT